MFNLEVYRLENNPGFDDTLSIVYDVKIERGMLDKYSTENDFQLEPFDLLVVRKDPEFEYHKNVKVEGEVKFPGVFPILRKNENFCSLIERAGGFTEEAFVPGIKFYRSDTIQVVGDFSNILRNKQECAIKLLPGDKVVVPKHPGTVEVEGEVKNPGLVYYRKGWSMNRYIEAAGDYTRDAVKRKTVVFYPGGSSKRKGAIFHPKVLEGSRIFVPKKREKVNKIDWTSIITQWGSIATSFATVFWIITRAN
jgi:protein involved in polysaccharide export with SLBB domain